jgi:hypothetical protein
MSTLSAIQAKFSLLSGYVDERSRRIWAATEARALGYGGVTFVSKATGISRVTINRGLAAIRSGPSVPLSRVRKTGDGRKSCAQHTPSFPERLEALVEPLTRGDPESPLRWTCKTPAA